MLFDIAKNTNGETGEQWHEVSLATMRTGELASNFAVDNGIGFGDVPDAINPPYGVISPQKLSDDEDIPF